MYDTNTKYYFKNKENWEEKGYMGTHCTLMTNYSIKLKLL